jgi:phospholipid/cholesterol/gamma-HCH transport system permease protein
MIAALRQGVGDVLDGAGALTLFAWQMLVGVLRRAGGDTLVPVFYAIGVRSVLVVVVTGLFIGMSLAEQAYVQTGTGLFQSHLGSIINISVVRELGPVLTATMLAGRVGGAMAAELATMRITEQIDALACLGVDPVHHLGAPRLLACVLLIPVLTVFADVMGVLGGALISTQVYHIDAHHYWQNTQGYVTMWDLATGLIKPTAFGAAIAVICCYRGFNASAGAEGVGQAATRAFVASFMAILILDFFLAMLLNGLHDYFWPGTRRML